MINRSIIKYHLKKILPKSFFSIILTIWSKFLIKIIEKIDKIRLKKFTKYHSVNLSYKNKDFSLFISPDNGFIDKHIFLYGVYEPYILDLFLKYIKKGDSFVDIGANIGQHSVFAALIVGESGKVYSFEPITNIYNQLNDSIKKNNLEKITKTFNFAIGEKNSTEKFYVSLNVGGSSLVNNSKETKEVITVNIKNGDDILNILNKVNVIKIDVEGYEYEVLLGIKNTILKHKPIIFIEYSGNFYKNQGNGNGLKILSFLINDCKYSLFDIEDDMKQVLDKDNFDKNIGNKRIQTNLLCIAN